MSPQSPEMPHRVCPSTPRVFRQVFFRALTREILFAHAMPGFHLPCQCILCEGAQGRELLYVPESLSCLARTTELAEQYTPSCELGERRSGIARMFGRYLLKVWQSFGRLSRESHGIGGEEEVIDRVSYFPLGRERGRGRVEVAGFRERPPIRAT